MQANDTSSCTSSYCTAALLACAVLLAGCASGSPTGPEPQYLAAAPGHASEPREAGDPFEKSNRDTMASNQQFNQSIIYPISDAYHENIPEPVRDSISNFTSNLGEPAIFANDILQLRLKAAATTTGRFLVNSTIGLGGLFDVASQQNIPKQTGDFGQTLYVWGVRESPYVVLPLLGPTNVRDALGNGIEMVATSVPTGGILSAKVASTVNSVSNIGTVLSPFSSLDKVDQLREVEKGSIDSYAMLKSLVEQKRQAELNEALSQSAFTLPTQETQSDVVTASIPVGTSTEAAALPWLMNAAAETASNPTPRPRKIVIGPEAASPETAPAPQGRMRKIVIGPDTAPAPASAPTPMRKIVIGPQ